MNPSRFDYEPGDFYLLLTVRKGIYVQFRKVRKAQFCGSLTTEQILLHYALGEPMFVALEVLREGRLLQDIKVGGRVHLDSICGSGVRDHYRSDKIVAMEGDVVVTTRKVLYRVTASSRHPDRPRHLRVLNQPTLSSGGMINLFSRANYGLSMNLVVSRFPMVFLDPNPHIFDSSDPVVTSIDPRDRVNLRYGIETNGREGWYGLIEEIAGTATDLVKALRESGVQPDAYAHSRIIKAKLGRLVWSGDVNLKEPFRTLYSGYVASVCARSTTVCEVTGQYGKLRQINGWWETLCDEEYSRRTKSRRPTRE